MSFDVHIEDDGTPRAALDIAGQAARAWGLDRITADDFESRSLATRIFQRRDGDWQMTHQYLSVPTSQDKSSASGVSPK